MKKRIFKKTKNSNINSDDVMENGLLIGCHHGLKNNEIKYIIDTVKKFIKENVQ